MVEHGWFLIMMNDENGNLRSIVLQNMNSSWFAIKYEAGVVHIYHWRHVNCAGPPLGAAPVAKAGYHLIFVNGQCFASTRAVSWNWQVTHSRAHPVVITAVGSSIWESNSERFHPKNQQVPNFCRWIIMAWPTFFLVIMMDRNGLTDFSWNLSLLMQQVVTIPAAANPSLPLNPVKLLRSSNFTQLRPVHGLSFDKAIEPIVDAEGRCRVKTG